METHESYTCTSCGYTALYPLKAEEVAECHRMRYERRMNHLKLGIIIVAAIAVPILISALLAYL